jgi:glycerol-3-phosphate dehydrogenase
MYDVAVVGGGINGAGIARDAAGRGLTTLLVEKDDLASHTSSSSTKLIHGGLRYLEYYEFRLVAEALAEREVLLHAAPHIIAPLQFVLPHEPHLRPAWMIRAGLFLYDHLGGRKSLPSSFGVELSTSKWGAGLKNTFHRGFVYADARVDDARLVVLNAISAREKGADIRTHTRLVAGRRENGCWRMTLQEASDETQEVSARALVNAAGP